MRTYAWIMTLRDGLVVDGTAYFDSIAFDELWRRLQVRNVSPAYGTVPITRELLLESSSRFQRPDEAELSLFDRCIVHRQLREP